MKFRELPLSGAYEITLEKHTDDRGHFARIYCTQEFAAHGLNTEWVQMNLSFNARAGTLRGLHFQRDPMAEVKLVRAVRGRVLDVIVDMRNGSQTFGKHIEINLDADQGNAIYIPKGFAHGFQTLSDSSELLYAHSTPYRPGHEGGINALSLGINWPLPPRNMSPRDRALAPLSECPAL